VAKVSLSGFHWYSLLSSSSFMEKVAMRWDSICSGAHRQHTDPSTPTQAQAIRHPPCHVMVQEPQREVAACYAQGVGACQAT
jgi:hypothetical protein